MTVLVFEATFSLVLVTKKVKLFIIIVSVGKINIALTKPLLSSVRVLQRWCSPSPSARLRPTPTGSVGLATSTRKALPTPTSSSRPEEGEMWAAITEAPTREQTAECVGSGLVIVACSHSPPRFSLCRQREKAEKGKAFEARQTSEERQERRAGEKPKTCNGVG